MVTPLRAGLPLRRWASLTYFHSPFRPEGPSPLLTLKVCLGLQMWWPVNFVHLVLPLNSSPNREEVAKRDLITPSFPWTVSLGYRLLLPRVLQRLAGQGWRVHAQAGILQRPGLPQAPPLAAETLKPGARGGVLRGWRPSLPEIHPRFRCASRDSAPGPAPAGWLSCRRLSLAKPRCPPGRRD